MVLISHLPERGLPVTLTSDPLPSGHLNTAIPSQALTKLVVIDSGVEGYQELVSGLLPHQAVAILHPAQDGIEQISYLLSQGNYTELAIVAHGEPGKVYLGNVILQASILSRYTGQLAEWCVQQIDLWSCQVAQDADFVAQLTDITKASVFASRESLGRGNWTLPGSLAPFEVSVLATWSGVLQAPVLGGVGGSVRVSGTDPKVLAPNLTITNFDDPTDILDGAIVSITGNFNASEDSLGILGQTGTSGTVNGLNWIYDTSTGILRLTGDGTAATYQAALRQVTYDPTGPSFAGSPRDVNFTLGSSLPYIETGNYYNFVSEPAITWDAAKTAAEASTLFGLQGYLATVTSVGENDFIASRLQGQGWKGSSDAGVNKVWRWVTGPEGLEDEGQGRLFFRQAGWTSDTGPNGSGNGAAADQPLGQYTNWAFGEPNDFPGGAPGSEDYGHFLANGQWNDYAINNSAIQGYVVEYGGLPGDPVLQISGNVTVQSGFIAAEGYFNFIQFTRATGFAGVTIPFTPVEVNGLQIPLLFDETYYTWKNPDVKAAVLNGQFISGYDHFIQFGQFEGRNPSTLYNEQYYLTNNPDVAADVGPGKFFRSGFEHFLLFGNQELRNPSEFFDQVDYLTGNPDVQPDIGTFFTSAFDHYIEFGTNEGRVPELILFQEAFYLEEYPDVRVAVQNGQFIDGYQHYLQFGALERRDSSPLFSEQGYGSLNPDVAAAIPSSFPNGLSHYLLFGREEGRPTQNVV